MHHQSLLYQLEAKRVLRGVTYQLLRHESREVGHFGRVVRNTLDCCLIKEEINTFLSVQFVLTVES